MTKDIGSVNALPDNEKLRFPQTARIGGEEISLINFRLISLATFCLALILQVVAYQNIEAPFVGIMALFIGYCVFHPKSAVGGRYEREAFLLAFSICYFWAGVAGIYSVYLEDISQKGDALWFFGLAANTNDGRSLDQIRAITSGSGAVFVWRAIYNFFSAIGFQKGPYIAIAFNTFLVAVSGVFGTKALQVIFNDDQRRAARFILLFSMCGVFWLFAATFLRDSFVLLLNTLLVYVWVRYLTNPTRVTAFFLIMFSAIATIAFAYLRTEFLFVPIAMLFAGDVAILIKGRFVRWTALMSVILTGLYIAVLPISITDFVNVIASGTAQYKTFANSPENHGSTSTSPENHGSTSPESHSSSLGVTYVVNQPILMRLAIGSFYLQIFPIPFWSGMFEGTVYHLLKSLNAIFMWFVIPFAVLGIYRSWQIKEKPEQTALLFLTVIYAGFSCAVAGSSLETRHLGSFLLPLLMLATVPDLRLRENMHIYWRLSGAWFGLTLFVYIAWFILKHGYF